MGVTDPNGPEVDCLLCQWGVCVCIGARGAYLFSIKFAKKYKAPKVEKSKYSEYYFLYSVIIILSKL